MNIKKSIKYKDNSYNLEKNNLELNKETLDYLIKNNITVVSTSKSLDELVKTLDEYTYSTYPNEILIYKGIIIKSSNIDKTDHMTINTTSLNKDNIEKIYKYLNVNNSLERVYISVNEFYKYNFYFNKDHVSIEITDISLDKVYEICKELSKSYKIDKLKIDFNVVDNNEIIKDVNYYDFDYEYLDELSKNTKIKINYRLLCGGFVDYNDFKELVLVIRNYRSMINKTKLSALEKLMMAYDIMKWYEYSESDKLTDTYTPDKIIKYGKITCVGYSLMMEEIFNCFDENIKLISVSLTTTHNIKEEGHKRNLVRIDDDKYNIHGLYFLDATWDSYNEKFKEKYGEDYKVNDVYKHFLVPICEYEQVFNEDTKPVIFSKKINKLLQDNWNIENLNNVLNSLNDEEINILNDYKIKIFKDIKKTKDMFKYACASRIPYESFLNSVFIVRQAEGFKISSLKDEVLRAWKTYEEYYEDKSHDIDGIIGKR